MNDKIIVTVKIGNTGQEFDVELPSNIEVGTLAAELLRTFHHVGVEGVSKARCFYLYSGKRRLQDNKTLTQNRIYDGSIINIIF